MTRLVKLLLCCILLIPGSGLYAQHRSPDFARLAFARGDYHSARKLGEEYLRVRPDDSKMLALVLFSGIYSMENSAPLFEKYKEQIVRLVDLKDEEISCALLVHDFLHGQMDSIIQETGEIAQPSSERPAAITSLFKAISTENPVLFSAAFSTYMYEDRNGLNFRELLQIIEIWKTRVGTHSLKKYALENKNDPMLLFLCSLLEDNMAKASEFCINAAKIMITESGYIPEHPLVMNYAVYYAARSKNEYFLWKFIYPLQEMGQNDMTTMLAYWSMPDPKKFNTKQLQLNYPGFRLFEPCFNQKIRPEEMYMFRLYDTTEMTYLLSRLMLDHYYSAVMDGSQAEILSAAGFIEMHGRNNTKKYKEMCRNTKLRLLMYIFGERGNDDIFEIGNLNLFCAGLAYQNSGTIRGLPNYLKKLHSYLKKWDFASMADTIPDMRIKREICMAISEGDAYRASYMCGLIRPILRLDKRAALGRWLEDTEKILKTMLLLPANSEYIYAKSEFNYLSKLLEQIEDEYLREALAKMLRFFV